MHNRARMIVASFLTKDLYLDWRSGAAHFMQELTDADVACRRYLPELAELPVDTIHDPDRGSGRRLGRELRSRFGGAPYSGY
jgi:deoxyribodipyrimidine photolyase